MELVRPNVAYKDSYRAAAGESVGEKAATGFDQNLAERDFDRFVHELRERAEGRSLPADYVPESIFWLVDGGEYIGRLSIRHTLNEQLATVGGHVGYDIRPSKRMQGYGTQILRLGLEKVRELGIGRVLLTCDETNIASRKIIESNGGVYERSVANPQGGPDKRRYWIDVR